MDNDVYISDSLINVESREAVASKPLLDTDKIKLVSYNIIKRLFDIIVAILGLILLIPIALFVKIAYVLNKDYYSIFYTQARIGKDGKLFKLYKFRTMVPNADKVLEDMLNKNPEMRDEWEENQKLHNDPRITKIGKFLRKSSLDELPQFLCILNNSMSMIGPRPLVEGELDSHLGNHAIYESVKPGITGWWACNGRSALEYGERLQLEYYYVRNRSTKLDIKCILKTISAVFNRTGAK